MGPDLEPAVGQCRDLGPELTLTSSLEPGLELELVIAPESLICLELGLRQGPRANARLLLMSLQELLSPSRSTSCLALELPGTGHET